RAPTTSPSWPTFGVLSSIATHVITHHHAGSVHPSYSPGTVAREPSHPPLPHSRHRRTGYATG
ncbi:MAG TPA: hypothetical protein VE132_15240, partial [Micromonosporaceae bacterium]|nr:hypothetical protein [Micromonosporaceae bacterium]